MSATPIRIQQIDAEIRRTVDARRRAAALRKLRLVSQLNLKLISLRRERARLLSRTKYAPKKGVVETSTSSSSAGRRFQLRDLLPSFRRSANKPPVGVIDRYAGVEPTAKNAPTLAAYYHARAKRRVQSRQARAYFLLRLEAVKPFLPNKTGPGKLVEAAKAQRQAASRAAGRKDYAASTRFSEQAQRLEQMARSLAIQESSASEAPPADEDTPETEAAATELEEGSAATDAVEEPWYMNPLAWLGGGVVGLLVLSKMGGKGGGKGSTSSTRKSYVVKSSSARSFKPRVTSTSLTRSL